MSPTRRSRLVAILAAGALVLAACGGEDEVVETTTTAAPSVTAPEVTAPDMAQGTGELVVSDGNTYPLAVDGTCDIGEDAIAFSAASDDVTLTVETTGGFGTLFMSGSFEAEGRVEEIAAADGVVTGRGIVTEADDTAIPHEFELTVHCG